MEKTQKLKTTCNLKNSGCFNRALILKTMRTQTIYSCACAIIVQSINALFYDYSICNLLK